MGIRIYQDLECWQLANDLKQRVYELIDRSHAKRDVGFCDQLRDAAASGPANLAEAFGAYGHPDSSRYARIARASLTETHNHLLDGVDRGFWKRDALDAMFAINERALKATAGWIRYLDSSVAPGDRPPRWRRKRRYS